jgi:hypothetical protein
VEDRQVQLIGPPVSIGHPLPPGERALGHVIHHCLLLLFSVTAIVFLLDDNLANASHQVKLTLVIAALSFSDD